MAFESSLLSVGIYSMSEASRLTGVSTGRIRRWLHGYTFDSRGKRHESRPLWIGDLDPIKHSFALSFLDVCEVRIINAFLKCGVRWKTIRRVVAKAACDVSSKHPFCDNSFLTDGTRVFKSVSRDRDDTAMLDYLSEQSVFESITRPFLRDLVFAEDGRPLIWTPLGKDRSVVVDPGRSFGQPIISSGVPTRILFNAINAGNSRAEVSQWFDIPESSVFDAFEFEDQMAA